MDQVQRSKPSVRLIVLRGLTVFFKLKLTVPPKLLDPRLVRWAERMEKYRV